MSKARHVATDKVAQDSKQDAATTFDSYSSFASTLSMRAGITDQPFNGAYFSDNRALLEMLYRKVWLCSKVVDTFAEDMTRGGINITGLQPAEAAALQKYMTSSGVWTSLTDLIKWARLYGGAVGYLDIDGQDPKTPLNLNTIAQGQFKGVIVYDKFRATPILTNFYADEPDFYRFDNMSTEVHASRTIKFIGVKLPYFLAQSANYWGDSVLERIISCVKMRETALKNAAGMVNRALMRTVKIDGLRDVLAAGGLAERNLLKMFDRMKEVQDAQGITLLDNTDTFQTDTFTFSGLNDLLTSFDQELAGASDIPMTRLYGQSPNGFSTGESDLQTYYDKVTSQQEATLREPLTKLLNLSYSSMTGQPYPTDVIDFDFVNVWKPNEIVDRQQIVNEINTILTAEGQELINAQTALIELRERGKRYGLFSSITDEYIANIGGLSEVAPALDPLDQLEFGLDVSELDSVDKLLEAELNSAQEGG